MIFSIKAKLFQIKSRIAFAFSLFKFIALPNINLLDLCKLWICTFLSTERVKNLIFNTIKCHKGALCAFHSTMEDLRLT